MKLMNKIKKVMGKKYCGCNGGHKKTIDINKFKIKSYSSDYKEFTEIPPKYMEMKKELESIYAKYMDNNITIAVYDSNSEIEFLLGPGLNTIKTIEIPAMENITLMKKTFESKPSAPDFCKMKDKLAKTVSKLQKKQVICQDAHIDDIIGIDPREIKEPIGINGPSERV